MVAHEAAPAAACSCVASSDAAQLQAADAVFVGTVLGSEDPSEPRNDGVVSSADPIDFSFAVERTDKGDLFTEEVVTTARSGASCGAEIGEGRYLVYAIWDGDELSTDLCGGTRPVDESDPVPSSLGAGRSPTGSVDPPGDEVPTPGSDTAPEASGVEAGATGVGEVTGSSTDGRWAALGLGALATLVVAGLGALALHRRGPSEGAR